jgi:hypothetical protein
MTQPCDSCEYGSPDGSIPRGAPCLRCIIRHEQDDGDGWISSATEYRAKAPERFDKE